MLFDYINFKFFLISLAVGLFFVYILDTPKKVIYITPNIDNMNKVLYKDNTDNCFKYEAVEMKCPSNSKKIEPLVLQK
jgi:hypothetical protein|tara:strand:+ start:3096 stop:3329 length:234 start_codon:yes stop_codon:yes gene_type:complete